MADTTFRKEIAAFKNCWIDAPHLDHALDLANLAYQLSGIDGQGQVITGPSGVGKSSLGKHIQQLVVTSDSDELTTYPSIRIELRDKATDKDVLLSLLSEMSISETRMTIRDLKNLLLKQLEVCRVKLIIIDEFQHLMRRNNRDVNSAVCDFLKWLIEHSNISILLMGMETGCKLFTIDDQLKSRFSDHVTLSPFMLDEGDEPEYFSWYLGELLKHVPMKTDNLLKRTDTLRLLAASRGMNRELKKIFQFSMILKDAPQSRLTMKDLCHGYNHLRSGFCTHNVTGRRFHPFTSTIDSVISHINNEPHYV